KQKNVTPRLAAKGHAGDVWTWVAMDAETRLVCSWLVGARDTVTATEFIRDLATYLVAVEDAFGADVDYAMLVKIYGEPSEGQKRYSPAECIGCERKTVAGNPDPKHISTS